MGATYKKLELTFRQLVTTIESAHKGSGKWKPLFGATYFTGVHLFGYGSPNPPKHQTLESLKQMVGPYAKLVSNSVQILLYKPKTTEYML